MTMPYLSNCPHAGEGWCLDCVKELHDSAAPPPLVWTDAKPTVPGWWWYREDLEQVVVEVYTDADGDTFGHATNDIPRTLDEFDGQFAGPIPHPADSREGEGK